MAEHELNLRDIVQQLPGTDAAHLPSPDLWPRIAAAHLKRQHRRRVRRVVISSSAAVMIFAAILVAPKWLAKSPAEIDWQARAQALEMQLNALAVPAGANTVVVDAELARLDGALQAAYDRGAPANELVPLWKQRSDLLSALLIARQQQTALTRI